MSDASDEHHERVGSAYISVAFGQAEQRKI
jgi:hypothetical protein